jgi:alpha-tubulin suppressor-like RCC1 family protein
LGKQYNFYLTICRWNTYGQLGIGTLINQAQAVRVNVNNYAPIHRIVCGYYQTFFFCGSETYSCGSNQSGILCRSTDYKTRDKNKKTPRLINPQNFFNKLQITDVGVGDYHALYLTEDGQVWLCGDNTKGQLGLPNKEYIYPPQPIPSDHVMFNGLGASDRVAFAVGRNHTMVYYTRKEKRELNWMRFRHLMFVATFDDRGFYDCLVKAIK